jgi:hypothetical protein
LSEQTGRVSVRSLRLRSGPGAQHAVIANLSQGTELIVLQRLNGWLKVKAGDTIGFVSGRCVRIAEAASPHEFLKDSMDVQKVVLTPSQHLEITGKPDPQEKFIERTWNSFGGLLEELSGRLKIDPAVAVAVLCVESCGKGFGPEGKLIIRFENHIFWRYWGKSSPSEFGNHFAFDEKKPWRGHRFRSSAKGRWKSVHGKGQTREWEVFEFARFEHPRFSVYSISMGMPQIMGFNHRRIGYKSVGQMFKSFQRGEASQIIGLFDFVAAPESNLLSALRKKDFLAFAREYNGPGQAERYARLIEGYAESFEELMRQKNS